MPLGFERLNERSLRPNALINFIKPLTSSSPQDQKIAQDFLERIAAQCYPVMKKDYVSVMSFEEFPPNPEFLGRNFNAGESIQLVLKDKAGRWLSFKFVQMVMMHELAHCKQMNHSRSFWKVRNHYADEMKELWDKKYEGEGLWGRGLDLMNGQVVYDRMPDSADIPAHLCGGTYRRARGRKRKRGQNAGEKPKLSYAERQQKRIAKKFGVHGEGQGLGEDELVRGALEQGKRRYGKPKVAKSKRGRDLRANAALVRFDAAKQQQMPEKTPESEDDGSETESDDEEYGDGLSIFDTLGQIKDQRGRDMYRVCGDESEQEEGGQDEMDELRLMRASSDKKGSVDVESSTSDTNSGAAKTELRLHEDSETESEVEDDEAQQPGTNGLGTNAIDEVVGGSVTNHDTPACGDQSKDDKPESPPALGSATSDAASFQPPRAPNSAACPICSLENELDSPTCIACSHVLKTSLMQNHWRCKGDQCQGSKYVNAGDAGRCGLCGAPKPVMESKPIGVTGADVLRWD